MSKELLDQIQRFTVKYAAPTGKSTEFLFELREIVKQAVVEATDYMLRFPAFKPDADVAVAAERERCIGHACAVYSKYYPGEESAVADEILAAIRSGE